MKLLILSPEKLLFEGEADSVILPGKEGSLGVLNNHAPYIVILKSGIVEWTMNTKERHKLEIKGGVAEIRNNSLIILSD